MASLADVASASLNRIQAARNELRGQDIVDETRNLFRRRRFRRDGETRGRKVKKIKLIVFLLSKANDDFVPSPSEQNRLQRCGFGFPSEQLSKEDRYPTPTELPLTTTIGEFEDILIRFYPAKNLQMTGFTFWKADQGRRLHQIEFETITELKARLKQGKLFLKPRRDLPINEPEDVAVVPPADVQTGHINDRIGNVEESTDPAPAEPEDVAVVPPADVQTGHINDRIGNVEESTDPAPAEVQNGSYIDADTPTVRFRVRPAAVRARRTIRRNAAYILADDDLPTPPSLSPEMPRGPPPQSTPSTSDSLEAVLEALGQLGDQIDGVHNVTVTRSNILKEILENYEDAEVLKHTLEVAFRGEIGEDAGGLTKDLFATFWEAAYEAYFTGEDCMVPHLPVHRYGEGISVYPKLGRVMCHGLALTKTLPVRISRSVLHAIVHGTKMPDENVLIEDFLSYISEHERTLTQAGLRNFDSLSSDEVLQIGDLFARFDMNGIPTKLNFKPLILNLAEVELFAKPLYLCQLMKKGIPDIFMDTFFLRLTQEEIASFYQSLKPSPAGVIALFTFEHDPLHPSEETVLYYLKDLIRSMTSDDLARFLQFVTGSCVMTSSITVAFNRSQGLLRHPRGRTCGNRLELPVGYDSLRQFKREFLDILRSDEAFKMSMY